MTRRTLFVLYEDLEDNVINNTSTSMETPKINIFQSFYRVKLSNSSKKIFPKEFGEILLNPDPTSLIKKFFPDTLVLAHFPKDRIGYIGVIHDIVSRSNSIEIPTELSWDEFIECAKQTEKSPIHFQ